jgi:hypothetical protein
MSMAAAAKPVRTRVVAFSLGIRRTTIPSHCVVYRVMDGRSDHQRVACVKRTSRTCVSTFRRTGPHSPAQDGRTCNGTSNGFDTPRSWSHIHASAGLNDNPRPSSSDLPPRGSQAACR